MSNNERISTDPEQLTPFDYLPSQGEILPMLQSAFDDDRHLSDVIEVARQLSLPSDKDGRKRAIAYIRQEGLVAQWHAEDLWRQGSPAATDVKGLANMISQVASVYGTAQPGVKREHDEVELAISRNLNENDMATEGHWTAFARDSLAVHGKIHKAFGVPSTIEILPTLPTTHYVSKEKTVPGMSKKQRAVATALATVFLSGALPTMAHAASETTPSPDPEVKSTVRPAVEKTNPNNPSDPANLLALAAPVKVTEQIVAPAPALEQRPTNNDALASTDQTPSNGTITATTIAQEMNGALEGLVPAVLPVVEVPNTVAAPSSSGVPEIASLAPEGKDSVGLVPAPVNAVAKPLDIAPGSGGTPEVAAPVLPALPSLEVAPTPAPAPVAQPKAPETPAPTPEVKNAPTAQDDYLQAAQDMTKAGGIWERRGTAMKFFIDKGLTPAQAAGFVGNLLGESGSEMNPGRSQVGGPAFGIAQWEAGRLAGLKAFGGDNYADFNVQLNYIWHELTTTEGNALVAVKSTSNRQDAAVAVRAMYERPSAHRDPERIAYANEVGLQFNVYYQAILAKRKPAQEVLASTTPEKVGTVAYTNQLDPAFHDMKYADGQLVGLTACGAASLDMVANTIGNKPGHGVTMRTMFADGTLPEGGTSQTFLMKEAPKFGLHTEYIKDYSIAAMKKVLDAGGLITFSGRTGTNLLILPGHFVVIYAVDVANGTMQVADPGNPANNGKWFSLQAELNGSAKDMANGGTGLHYGFIAYYPSQQIATTSVDVQPPVETPSPTVINNASTETDASADATVVADESAAQKAVDRAKRAVAAAKAATEQVQREKDLVK